MARAERRALDAYYSPDHAAAELLLFTPEIRGARILECCVGDGALSKPLAAAGCEVFTNDLDPKMPANYHADARYSRAWRDFPRVDFVVTNPPFNFGLPILRNAIEHASIGVFFFLRLTFLEPTAKAKGKNAALLRAPFFRRHPVNDLDVLPRISFTGDGKTDSATCAWMGWYRRRRPQRIKICTDPPIITEGRMPPPSLLGDGVFL